MVSLSLERGIIACEFQRCRVHSVKTKRHGLRRSSAARSVRSARSSMGSATSVIGDLYYNGLDQRDFAKAEGLAELGVENVGPIVTRGVLIDAAGYKGVEHLGDNYEITRADLEGALKKQGVQITPGDVVVIHTGWGKFWMTDNDRYNTTEPGIGLEAGQYLVDQKIVMLCCDNWGIEVVPNPDETLAFPVHQLFIAKHGIYNLENIITEELAAAKAYEFAFSFAPLRLKGATGSPGNPIAIR